MLSTLSVVLLLMSGRVSLAAKILLMPGYFYSHCLQLSSTGHALASKGHQVYIIFSSEFQHKNCHQFGSKKTKTIQPIIVKKDPSTPSIEELTSTLSQSMGGGKQVSGFDKVSLTSAYSTALCKNILHDKEAIKSLEQMKFDLAIVDCIFMTYCYYLLPYKLGIQFVSACTSMEDFVTGRPFLPSVVPATFPGYTDDMNFFQRLLNMLGSIAFHAMVRCILPMDVITKDFPEMSRQGLIDLASKSELFLLNQDPVLGYPVPVMPNHVLIGGIAVKPSKPLTGHLKQLYDDSKQGIVLVTFGSSFALLDKNVEENLMRALQRLQFDVIWKYDKEDRQANVRRMKWVPQNDLLAHPKTKLFVSHCGNNGLFEALYHGVPALCTPLFGDQFYNARRVEKWRVGKLLYLLSSSEEEIFQYMTEIVENRMYKENMAKASEMYRSQPHSPQEKAVHAIEHVIKFGGNHLRSKASEISTIVYAGYDIFCFVLVALMAWLLLAAKIIAWVFRYCFKRKEKLH